MVVDRRRALLRKEAVESARLADFDFRLRAQTYRRPADDLGLSGQGAELAALPHDETVFEEIACRSARSCEEVAAMFFGCPRDANGELVAEPSPHRPG